MRTVPRIFKSWRPLAVVAGVLAASAIAAFGGSAAFAGFEDQAQAVLIRAHGVLRWDPDVVLVVLDDKSRPVMGTPTSRKRHAEVIRALLSAKPRVVGIDMAASAPPFDGPEANEAFAAAMRSGPVVLPVECAGVQIEEQPDFTATLGDRALDPGGLPYSECPGSMLPNGVLATAADSAHMEYAPSASGYARSLPLLSGLPGGKAVIALGAQTWITGRGVRAGALVSLADGVHGHDNLFIGAEVDGNRYFNVRGAPNEALIPVSEVIAHIAPDGTLKEPLASKLRGKWILYGNTTRTAADYRAFADGRDRPLLAMHAALLMDLLEGRWLRPLNPAWVLLVDALLAAIAIMLSLTFVPVRATVSLLALDVAYFALAATLLERGTLVPLAAPLFTAAAAFAGVLTVRLIVREQERALLRDAFSSYVDSHVLSRVMEDPDKYLALGGARRNITVLFSDVVGYTQLTNRLGPEASIALLREYLEVVTALVKRQQGRVDKIMGDGVLAVFGDPMPVDDHAVRGVEVALEMQREVARLRQKWPKEAGGSLAIRIGIATGEAFVGNIGAAGSKIEYTVLGATVNLASRLEGKSPPDKVVISAATHDACGERFLYEPLRGLSLKGFEQPYDAWIVSPRG